MTSKARSRRKELLAQQEGYGWQHDQSNDYIRLKFIYSVIGLILGLVCIISGVVLFFNGVAGSTSWAAKVMGLESSVAEAAPGTVIFIVGLFVVWTTRYKVVTTGSVERIRDYHDPVGQQSGNGDHDDERLRRDQSRVQHQQ
jgi:hypothetical protein